MIKKQNGSLFVHQRCVLWSGGKN